MNTLTDTLVREILQVRFRPTLSWFAQKIQTIEDLERDFSEWRVDERGVVLYSPDKNQQLEIFTDQFTYVNESELNTDKAQEYMGELVSKISSKFGISEIRRIGYRVTKVAKSKFTFEELTDFIFQQFYNTDVLGEDSNGNRVSDLAYVLNTTFDGINSHVQFGAVKKAESINYFKPIFDSENARKKVEDDDNLFFDLDIFSDTELTTTNLKDVIKRVVDTNRNLSSRYITKLLS